MTDAECRRDLAATLRAAQWALDDAAFKLPRGELPNVKRVELAGILHDLADLLIDTLTVATAEAPPVAHLPQQRTTVHTMTGTDWPEELELLGRLRESGWTLWAFGDRQRPDALAAVRIIDATADVIVIRGHDRVTAYRTPIAPDVDPLRADAVTWHHTTNALNILRDVVPRIRDVSGAEPYPTPDECRLPELDRRPITVVPPRHSQTRQEENHDRRH